MASRLAHAHIEGQRRLRLAASRGVRIIWKEQPSYDRRDTGLFVARAVPLVTAAQYQSALLTNAFLAERLERQPLAFEPRTGEALRNGTPMREVYERPFVTVWTAMSNGAAWKDAVGAGLARAEAMAEMDVQLAMRGALTENEQRDERITGYERVADAGACAFCSELEGSRASAEALPLHDRCGCGVEPVTEPFDAPELPDGVGVEEHGELGPVLVNPEHNFDHA